MGGNMPLRLSELYSSVQGEGYNTGLMTVFVRFAGCNMRCPGWPCDTPHAIFPEIWRHESELLVPAMLAARIMDVCEETGAKNICYTGGEPFVQKSDELYEVTRILMGHGNHCEVFTNGSFIFPEWAVHALTFMMDWKLAGSQEAMTHREERTTNAHQLKVSDGIKFVVVDEEDLNEAQQVSLTLRTRAQYWVGAAWGRISDVEIIDYVRHNQLPWRLNVQTHKHIWPPDERGV
jgi:7-carboxy-7-deazaguanine synthase